MARHRTRLTAVILMLLASRAACAPPQRAFAVPGGTLDRAIATLAAQADIDVGGALAGLDAIRTGGVRGRMTAARALARLLAGTGYTAVAAGRSLYRIARSPAAVPKSKPVRAGMVGPELRGVEGNRPVPDDADSIVVTANKQGTSQFRFPGSVAVLRSGLFGFGREAATPSLDDAAGLLPILQSTDLGAGRNKLFVRGIADSSFDGPTQATASTYFGDVQLGYNGPDPDLNLYDVDTVEVLEGPQGTLYGAGAIGGIVRLSPHPAELSRLGASVSLGLVATEHGALGHDEAAMLNVPIVEDALAVRAVGYHDDAGGYIDDVRRGLSDVNRTVTDGGRVDLREDPGSGWLIDAGALFQTIAAPDSQYAQRGLPGLARAATLAQPFEDDFLLGRLVVTKQWDSGVRLLSATGWASHQRSEQYDATGPALSAPPTLYAATNDSHLFTEEARLSRALPSGAGWVIGASLLLDRDAIRRRIGAPAALNEIVGVANRTLDAAIFGEATIPVTNDLLLTAGGRLTRARTDSNPTGRVRNSVYVDGRTTLRVDPTIGLSWLVAPRLAAFARYESGFRTGGISVAPGIGRVQDFRADTIGVSEAGLRLERSGARGVAGSVTVSYARWSNIQADLVDPHGLPYTTNIGDGRLLGIEGTGEWVPFPGLHASLSAFFDDSRLRNPIMRLSATTGDTLPDTPRLSASGGISYRWRGAGGVVEAAGTIRYVGRSFLGAGPLLDVRQGGYVDDTVSVAWSRAAVSFSAALSNLADTHGDRFAVGNPFELIARDQYTPLRPRSVRLAMRIAW